MKVTEAIAILSETYLSLDSVAQGLDVAEKDVTAALAKAKPDTTEYVCLQALARKFPTKQEMKQDDSSDSDNG